MLTEHLEVCREEDDSTHLLDLGNLDGYYDSDEEDADDPKYQLSDDRSSGEKTYKVMWIYNIPKPQTQIHISFFLSKKFFNFLWNAFKYLPYVL